MKTFALFLMAISLCHGYVDHELVIRRAKREVSRMSFADLRSMLCVNECLNGFKDTLGRMKAAQSRSFMDEDTLDQGKFEKFCSGYDRFEGCVSDCRQEDSPLTQAVVGMFDAFEMLCDTHKQEFISYLPCLREAHQPATAQCTEHCGSEETFATDLRKNTQRIVMKYRITGNQRQMYRQYNKLMDDACDYASCLQQCHHRVIVNTCEAPTGRKAAKLINSVAEKTMMALSKGIKTMAPEMQFPADCLSRGEEDNAHKNRITVEKKKTSEEDDSEEFFF